MNVVFVTRRQHNTSSRIQTLTVEQAREIRRSWKSKLLSHDLETPHWDPYLGDVLLEAWWSGETDQPLMVIDKTSVETGEVIDNDYLKDKLIISHNADFEARWNLKRGLWAGEYYCTMVASQTILCGAEDLSFDIISELRRRGIKVPPEMNKDIRHKFIGKSPTIVFEDEDILYNAADIVKLHELYAKQRIVIESMNITFLIDRLRMPLVKELARAEITGFVHDTAKWLSLAEERKKESAKIQEQLNKYLLDNGIDIYTINPILAKEVTRIENQIRRNSERIEKLSREVNRLEAANKRTTKAYLLQRDSLAKCIALSSDPPALPSKSVNWGSPQQPIRALRALQIPIPKAKDQKTKQWKEGIGKMARANWFAENETHTHMGFMKLIDKFKKIEHNIKSFGERWVSMYVNAVSGKVHTCFRQAGTRTGRFASGNKDNGYFNLQQIPSREGPEYRNCFRTELGRTIATLDYKGCEVVCMISLAKDLELKRISELPDQHSYMGTKCWRAVYESRYQRTGDPKLLDLSKNFVMTNEGESKKMRTKFKESGIFPVIYGVGKHKVASIQGFTPDEGQIFINTIEADMPNVVTFVKSKAAQALREGFVIHNTRTNSRRTFMKVLDFLKYGFELSNGDKAKVEAAARNTCVQGTNVDIIIESIITIVRWARLYKVDVRLLGQVHDETIWDFPEDKPWILDKLKELKRRAAQRYLIPEISMDVDGHAAEYWSK